MPLILASTSPRRLDLLRALKIEPVVVAPTFDETPLKKELPRDYVARLAMGKAASLLPLSSPAWILGADTTIEVGRHIFQKAETPEEAYAQISLFSGRRHKVWTAFSLISPQGKAITRTACTTVTLKRLEEHEKKLFVDSKEWEGVCGYRILGLFGAFVRHIQGEPSTILGLPVGLLWRTLQGNGFFT